MKTQSSKRFLSSFVLWLLLAIVLISCDKVSPGKVERKITKDSWVIVTFNYESNDIASDYANYRFGFAEEGGSVAVFISGLNTGQPGGWSIGLNNDPTILYLEGFVNVPLTILNNDWTVTSISDDNMNLESDGNTIGMQRLE
ncbi:MAG: hypothetical protein QNK23_04705 [Crocinitomicaceae bacterium]|nr:hypothetical protein [Crocinitomicaceae bacterium]